MATEQPRTRPGTTSRLDPEEIEQFLRRYGDLIDDHVAEIVEEVVAARMAGHRPHRRLPLLVVVLAATGVCMPLLASPVTIAAIWVCAAVICGCLAYGQR